MTVKYDWWNQLLTKHGERLFFGALALLIATGVYILIPELQGEVRGIILGVAMICFNKMRGNGKEIK